MTSEQFKTARKAKKMTQRELAVFLNVSLSAVTKWETGANPIPDHVAEKLHVRSVLKISELGADELAVFQKKAAERGRTPDSITAELIRNFIKLSAVAVLIYLFL